MRYWTILSFLVFVGLAGEAAAQTVSCDITSEPYPADGEVGVPLNPILAYPIMVPSEPLTDPGVTLTLEDSSGVQVSLEKHANAIGGDCSFVYVPTVDLMPSSDYVVRADGDVLVTFTTGQARDDDPPDFDVNCPGEGVEFDQQIEFTCSEDVALLDTGYGSSQSFNYVVFSPTSGVIDQTWIIQRLNAGDDLFLVAVDRAGNTTDVWIDGYDDGDDSEPGGASANGCSFAGPQRAGAGTLTFLLLAAVSLMVRRRLG